MRSFLRQGSQTGLHSETTGQMLSGHEGTKDLVIARKLTTLSILLTPNTWLVERGCGRGDKRTAILANQVRDFGGTVDGLEGQVVFTDKPVCLQAVGGGPEGETIEYPLLLGARQLPEK